MTLDRILVHQSERRRIPLDPAEIFYLEADDYQTVIRLADQTATVSNHYSARSRAMS